MYFDPLRTKETKARYAAATKSGDFFLEDPAVAEYEYWRVIKNSFPYDVVADVHNLLAIKRLVASENDLTPEELAELKEIKSTISNDGSYDVIMLNFPKRQTQPQRLHYHLLVYKVIKELEN